jgi:mono/diheme cytochrome c family protein
MIGVSARIAIATLTLLASGCRFSAEGPPPTASTRSSQTQRPSQDGHATYETGNTGDTRYALGRSPTVAEIEAWDIDVMPDGEGLPVGSGNVANGRTLYATQCLRCHGAEGRGGPLDQLAGRLPDDAFPFALDPRAKHTIGNYWPWATTLFDYTRRAMPLDRPGSLEDNEVYALTAYLLYLNDLLDEGSTLDRHNLPLIVMPARDRFVADDRRGGPEIR